MSRSLDAFYGLSLNWLWLLLEARDTIKGFDVIFSTSRLKSIWFSERDIGFTSTRFQTYMVFFLTADFSGQ
ncbi:hypothetical protein BDN72DRAFT_842028 [Pluteus cervinus]|uniref:Uncharacterized protein n=1 Tax=Pluteus cervinus TaxID=181527 RepID=A0ACD3AR95_9AGAR|nr:hypothetical protein BDN72DRAFT_842028 [Pluteus cervinus]